jgi:murein L,D-transpeptidase YafK
VPAPSLPPAVCERIERLTVHKAERRLVASCAGGLELEFPVGLSREPVGAKRRIGDLRVPEGEYRVAGPARASRFHLFLPIDYPSASDAERAFAEGLITRGERDAIARAHAAGRLPPQHTALGGRLGIHGEGERWQNELDLDWTEGCIAVSDAVIDWLAAAAPGGTPVAILP